MKVVEDYIRQVVRICTRLLQTGKNEQQRKLFILKKIDETSPLTCLNKKEIENLPKPIIEKCELIKREIQEILNIYNSDSNIQEEKINEILRTIIKCGENYLKNDNLYLIGFNVEKKQYGLIEQSEYLASSIKGIEMEEWVQILYLSYEMNFIVVVGGSSIKNNRVGKDLDIGFKESYEEPKEINIKEIIEKSNIKNKEKIIENCLKLKECIKKCNYIEKREKIRYLINKINKKILHWYAKKFKDDPKHPLIEDTFIYDGSSSDSINIQDVREFFTKSGFRFRDEKSPEKQEKPFGPSGFVELKPNGETTKARPMFSNNAEYGEQVFYQV